MLRISSVTQFSARCDQSIVPKNGRLYIHMYIYTYEGVPHSSCLLSVKRKVNFLKTAESIFPRESRLMVSENASTSLRIFDSRVSLLLRPVFPAVLYYFSISPPHISYLVLLLSLSLSLFFSLSSLCQHATRLLQSLVRLQQRAAFSTSTLIRAPR